MIDSDGSQNTFEKIDWRATKLMRRNPWVHESQGVRTTSLCHCKLNRIPLVSLSHATSFNVVVRKIFVRHLVVFSCFQRKILIPKHRINLVWVQCVGTVCWYSIRYQVSAVCSKLEVHIQICYAYFRKYIFITSIKDE